MFVGLMALSWTHDPPDTFGIEIFTSLVDLQGIPQLRDDFGTLFQQSSTVSLGSMEERLQRVDPSVAGVGLNQQLQGISPGIAMRPEDEIRVTSFLHLLARASDLNLLDAKFYPGDNLDGVQPINVRLTMDGSPYNLPIFLDGLHRQRTVPWIRYLKVRKDADGIVQMEMDLRYHRPATVDLSWIADQLQEEGSESEALTGVMTQAHEVLVWRHFLSQEKRLVERALADRRQAVVDMSALLISLKQHGGVLTWSPEAGGEYRPPA